MSSIYLYFFYLFCYFIIKQEKIYIFKCSATCLKRIRTVLAPYILRSKVLLHEESTERVRSRYGFDTSQMLLEVFKTWCLCSLYIFTTRRCVYQRRITGARSHCSGCGDLPSNRKESVPAGTELYAGSTDSHIGESR